MLIRAIACLSLTLLVTACASRKTYPSVAQLPRVNDLPDPFVFTNGSRVQTKDDWTRRRAELRELIMHYEYGELPPAPHNVKGVLIISHFPKRPAKIQHRQYKVTCGPHDKLSFVVDLLLPPGDGPFPVIVRGDACWGLVKDEIADQVIARGYALAQFNRCEFSPDLGTKNAGMFLAYPNRDFGAVAAWAWGIHRCIDFLETLKEIDKAKIVVTGHSRGGKAALLAGALDERIAITAPNGSGTGGCAPYRNPTAQAEKLSDILRNFPGWFSPQLKQFVGHEDQLPFDQHELIALVAPRAFLTTEGLGDQWANPPQTYRSVEAARTVWDFLGAFNRTGIHYRPGKHEHGLEDWKALLEFADKIFFNKPTTQPFDRPPTK
ncbi:MAG TPA: alpha/beta fold hydrolase [Tepidisphaeraceae bacterium]|nr:alpha/beta fold hydrolase [Tepidisphaeraceae bacterium]